MFRKNLCDKVSKMKNLRWLFSSFFRADRRGVLCFFGRRIFHRENCETKSPVLTFLKKREKQRKVRRKTRVKNRKIFFSVSTIFKSRPSRSFCTPKLCSQTFLKCRNCKKSFMSEQKIHCFGNFPTDRNDQILIGQIYTRSMGRTEILDTSMSKSSDRPSKCTPRLNSSVLGRSRNLARHMG